MPRPKRRKPKLKKPLRNHRLRPGREPNPAYNENAMVVSMIQMIFEIPDAGSLKEKRRIVRSVKDKLQRRFHLSAAEVDLQDSITFAQIGGALVSNSKVFGESVLQKAFAMIENEVPVRIQDISIYSEEF
jgi:uncharacterized protein YlxP (DUF503 family)